jgi:hypothetical protein
MMPAVFGLCTDLRAKKGNQNEPILLIQISTVYPKPRLAMPDQYSTHSTENPAGFSIGALPQNYMPLSDHHQRNFSQWQSPTSTGEVAHTTRFLETSAGKSESIASVECLRILAMRLIDWLPPQALPEAIEALGGIHEFYCDAPEPSKPHTTTQALNANVVGSEVRPILDLGE